MAGVGFFEILLVLILVIIFVDPKHIPGLLRRSLKIAHKVRTEIRKILDDVNKL